MAGAYCSSIDTGFNIHEKMRCVNLNNNVDDNLKTASLLTLEVEILINKYKHKNVISQS